MELRHLRYFLAVAEELSFTKAARRLHISQPALSQQIRAAEKIAGVSLFHRDAGGIRLTTAGEALLEPASKILTAVADAVRTAKTAASADDHVLRVGLPWAEGLGELTRPILSTFAESFPQTRLIFRSLDPDELYNGLPNDAIDVALARLPLDPETHVWTRLFEDKPVACVAIGNPIFEADALRIADIIEMPMPDLALKASVPNLMAYWRLHDYRGGCAPCVIGEQVSSAMELAYTTLRYPSLVSVGPEPVRRYPPLAATLIRFIDIIDAGVNCAVVARRRGDRRPAVMSFCEVARTVTRQMGKLLLPDDTTVCD